MNTLSILLVVIAAVFHSVWNIAAKKSGGTTVFAFGTALLTALIWIPLALVTSYGYPELSASHWSLWGWLSVLFSAGLHSLYYLALLHGYKVAPLTVVYPVARGVGPLISSFAAIAVFNEALTVNTVLGVALIALGVFLLTWSGKAVEDRSAALTGITWGAITGVTISAYTIADAYAVKILLLNPLLFDYWSNVFRVLLLFPLVFRRISEVGAGIRQDFRPMLIVAVLGPTAYILVLTAIQMSPVSHVAPARELSLLIGALLGGTLLKEGYLLRRMSAALLIALGVILLSI